MDLLCFFSLTHLSHVSFYSLKVESKIVFYFLPVYKLAVWGMRNFIRSPNVTVYSMHMCNINMDKYISVYKIY